MVEGTDDLFAIAGLMKAHIDWPDDPPKWPVFILDGKGVDKIAGLLTAEIKAEKVQSFGLVLDADINAGGRYQRIRQLCSELFPSLPDEQPVEGLVVDNGEKRFGVWLMPDNLSGGDLETFLRFLVPNGKEPLWTHACDAVHRASILALAGAIPIWQRPASITWLAWQDPPGQSPGVALTARILDPKSQDSAPFVAWFRRLYQL